MLTLPADAKLASVRSAPLADKHGQRADYLTLKPAHGHRHLGTTRTGLRACCGRSFPAETTIVAPFIAGDVSCGNCLATTDHHRANA
jgi:hypothetical protein